MLVVPSQRIQCVVHLLHPSVTLSIHAQDAVREAILTQPREEDLRLTFISTFMDSLCGLFPQCIIRINFT